jgi:hypothetical protein
MKWFRMHGDLIHDPKLLKLPDDLFRFWIGILCIASKNEGNLPGPDDIGLVLRIKPKKAADALSKLVSAGLIDDMPDGRRPHNWDRWQYKSDDSTARVKRHRQRQRNVSETVTETPPETDTEAETDSETEREGETAAAVPRAPIARKGKTGWPSDLALTPRHIDFAKNTGGFNLSHAQAMFEAFARYHKSEGTQSADWNLSWERWVHQEIKFNGKPGQQHNSFL